MGSARRAGAGIRCPPLSVQNTRTKSETVRVFWTLNVVHAGCTSGTARDAGRRGPGAGTPGAARDAGRGAGRGTGCRHPGVECPSYAGCGARHAACSGHSTGAAARARLGTRGPDAGTPAASVHDTPGAGRGVRRALGTRPGDDRGTSRMAWSGATRTARAKRRRPRPAKMRGAGVEGVDQPAGVADGAGVGEVVAVPPWPWDSRSSRRWTAAVRRASCVAKPARSPLVSAA